MQYWVLFFLAAFALSMSSVLSVGSSQSKPSLKDLRRAKAEVFTELHPLSTVDPTKLQIVPRKGRYLQSVGGWAYATLYYNECGAEDDAFVAYGMATDVCLSSETKNGQQSRSFIYSCTDSTWSIAMYNSTNCDDADFMNTNTFNVAAPSECGAYPPSSSDDDTLAQYVARYYCEIGATANLKADYVLNKYYDNNTCTELGSFSGSRDHGCFPYHFDNQTFSVKTIYPFEKFYSNADCTGEVLLSDNLAALQDTCAPPPTDDDAVDDDVDSMQFTAYTSSITCTVPSTSTCSSSGNSDDASLSTGALIGIIVGGAVGFMLVLVVIYLIYRSCCKKADANRGGEISVPL